MQILFINPPEVTKIQFTQEKRWNQRVIRFISSFRRKKVR